MLGNMPTETNSKMTIVPDGPGKYVFRLKSVGSCVGQAAESNVTMLVECNSPPVPDAIITSQADVMEDGELLPVFKAPPPAPPPLPPPPPPKPPSLPPMFGMPKPPQAPPNPPSTRRRAPSPYPDTVPFPDVPRCFKKVMLDGNVSFDPEEGRSWAGGDTFTFVWSLTNSPPPSILSRRTLGDPHASFEQTDVTALLRPDREGTYTCTLEVYDGCAPPVTKAFDITVVWEQECVTRAEAKRLGFATPLVFVLALITLAGLSFLPPLSWKHPRQVMLDAMAAAAARRAAEFKAVMHAEAVVDAPRLHATHERESREGRERRMARRAAAKDTALRGLPPLTLMGEGQLSGNPRSPGGGGGGGDYVDPGTPTSARRRGQAVVIRKATALEKAKAWLTLVSDYGYDVVDTLTWRPLRAFFHVRSFFVRLWMWLFHVPGGWMGLLLRAHLVLELPALVSPLIRPGVPPFARDGGGTGGIVSFVTPALLLGANMTKEDVYMALTVFTGFAVLALTGPGLGIIFAWLSRRTWAGVWRIADTVEAGGVVVTASQLADPDKQAKAEAKISILRYTRQRKTGVTIPREVWRMGSDEQTKLALAAYCEIPSVKKHLLENEDEELDMEKWMRKGLKRRRYARWLFRLGKAVHT